MSTGREEAQEYIEIGTLNGLFVLGRTVGFIGMSLSPLFLSPIINRPLYFHPMVIFAISLTMVRGKIG